MRMSSGSDVDEGICMLNAPAYVELAKLLQKIRCSAWLRSSFEHFFKQALRVCRTAQS